MKHLQIIMIAILLIPLFPIQSYAFSCLEIEGPVIEHHDLAIVGTVLDVKNDIIQKGFTGAKEIKKNVLLSVEQSWKKEVDSQILMEGGYTWGYPFEEGKNYLIYLEERNGTYLYSPCSPVSEVNSNKDVEAILGKGGPPVKEVNLSYKMWFMTDKDFDLLFVIVSLSVVLVFIWKRYSKKIT